MPSLAPRRISGLHAHKASAASAAWVWVSMMPLPSAMPLSAAAMEGSLATVGVAQASFSVSRLSAVLGACAFALTLVLAVASVLGDQPLSLPDVLTEGSIA